ncbi:hypothetical protein [Streptomyces sp. NPDC005301]|uniref:hypothetical protein n=1 Tax=Streptomyces sp. NPDC005301 TaxID=3156874 RepID=UPI0033AF5DA0
MANGWQGLPTAEDDQAWTLAQRRIARRRNWLLAAAAVTGFVVVAAGTYLIVDQNRHEREFLSGIFSTTVIL